MSTVEQSITGVTHNYEVKTDLGFRRTFHTKDGNFHVIAKSDNGVIDFKLTTNEQIRSTCSIKGLPLLFERSDSMRRKDVMFFADFADAYLMGGGIAIMIDHRDDYVVPNDPRDDEGAHYALIDTTEFFQGEHRFKRNAHTVIPLPIFSRLLERGWVWDEKGSLAISDKVRWNITDVIDFLNSLFPGRVCIADAVFHRLDASIGNTGIVPPLGGYKRAHGLLWEDPLCQTGIYPSEAERLIQAYNAPDEIIVVKGGHIVLVNTRTETEEVITKGKLVGKLTPQGESTWTKGLKHPKAPAHGLYEILD